MIQTLDLPVLSLAIPNIHKLNTINADDLSCMWTGTLYKKNIYFFFPY